jgi:hypothetical protein
VTCLGSDLYLLINRKHGTYRPTLGKLVAKNSDEKVAEATKDAFSHYASHPDDIRVVLDKLSKPLSGIGPATGSLLLAIHDPQNVIYFSDELYRWLLHDGKKISPKYTPAEFEELYNASKSFMARLKCTPIELEKVAFVIIKESDPTPEPAEKKVPSGKPRGRPTKPDSEKKVKVPSGRPRGRPAKPDSEKEVKPSATMNNLPVTKEEEEDELADTPGEKSHPVVTLKGSSPGNSKEPAAATNSEPEKRGRAAKVVPVDPAPPAAKKRGRPAKVVEGEEPATAPTRKRGRPAKVVEEEEEPATPPTKKRGRPASNSATNSSNKKGEV